MSYLSWKYSGKRTTACEQSVKEDARRASRLARSAPLAGFTRTETVKTGVNLSSFFATTSWAGLATLGALLLCSVVMVALGRDLSLRTRAASLDGDPLLAQLRYLLAHGSPARAAAFLEPQPQPLPGILRELLRLDNPTLERGDYLLAGLLERERGRLESGLPHLGTIAVIAPFVGLLGTVIGITKTFADVARSGKAGIEVVSAGVSEALVATALGLLVAIVSVVLFNAFRARIDALMSDWEATGHAFLSLLVSAPEEREALFDSFLADLPAEPAKTWLQSSP